MSAASASAQTSPPPETPSPAPVATVVPIPTAVPIPSAAPLPPAGTIPLGLTLDVTGVPFAGAWFLDAAIRDALDRAIRPTLRPGSSVAYGPINPWPLIPLNSGSRSAVNVTVTIAGDGSSAPVTGITTVTLNSVLIAAPAPAVLFLSDDPEYLQTEGLIFRGDVTPARSARLYYYHSNIGVPRGLDVILTATAPARVHLMQSKAGPELDVMNVGHTVSRDYLRYASREEGIVADVAPGKPFVVRHGLLLQGEVVAGAVDIRPLSGNVAVSVVASPAGTRPDVYLSGPRIAFDGHRRHGTFDLRDYGALAATYTVGGPPVFVQYGNRTAAPRNLDPADDGRDYGDYGVVHRITFTLANPTDIPHTIYLYVKPLGGPLRSTFVIDGQLKEVGCVRLSEPYWVSSYQLGPRSTGASTTLTMPDGGSFFPAEYGVTDQPPQSYTPPVGSAEGCSPIGPAFPEPTSTPNHR